MIFNIGAKVTPATEFILHLLHLLPYMKIVEYQRKRGIDILGLQFAQIAVQWLIQLIKLHINNFMNIFYW